MKEQIEKCVEQAGCGQVASFSSLSGGCISEVNRLKLRSGNSIIAKYHASPPDQLFTAESEGLNALSAESSMRIPKVFAVSENIILLEDLGSGTPTSNFWQTLGEGLAELHSKQQKQFGFTMNNYCGATPQDNSPCVSGYDFFANNRLLALGSNARQAALLNENEWRQLEYIANHLSDWIPNAPAVLIHGDLWSGNVHCTSEGDPALIDPAAYWGWAEAELAMTDLFGGFDPLFYASYIGSGEVASDWRERIPLYNLYHLLNHLLLFGGSYHGSVAAILNRYGN